VTASGFRKLVCLLGLTAAGSANADFIGNLGPISAPASLAFSNSTATSLSLSTQTLSAPYNFVDRWNFILGGNASITSLAAAFKFDDGAGGLATFGIDNLQVNLLDALGVVAAGWQTVTTTGPFTQTISFTPSSALADGNYSLQVRGQLLAAPAAYSGSLIAAAPAVVPLPAALPLFLLGLGVFGASGARQRKAAATA